MSDEIGRLSQFQEIYRHKARTAGWTPLSAAYGEAADLLDEKIARLRAASPRRLV
jgi:hypothetical protein